METPKGEERPSPPPRPVGRSPGDRPKVGPRVATKPQPALPKRPPVASKPTTSATNGVQLDSGLPTFPKTPPPLPSLPPCASQREVPKQPPVPAPRRLSQVLPEQATLEEVVADPGPQDTDNPVGSIHQEPPPEQTEQQSDTPREAELIENSVGETELQEPVQGVETSVSETPKGVMNATVTQPLASGPPRPKPPVKPAVKPKPKVMSKPRRTSANNKDNTSETVKVTAIPQVKTAEVPETKKGNNQRIHKDNTSETVKVAEIPQVRTVEVPETKKGNNQRIHKDNTSETVKVAEIPQVKTAEVPETKKGNNQRIHKDNTSETVKVAEIPQVRTVEVPQTKGEKDQSDSRTEMCAQDVESKLTHEDKTSTDRVDPPLETSHNTEESKENVTQNGTVINQVDTPSIKGSESSFSLAESEPCETPTRPPRKKRMSKSFSQGSITAGSNENLSASPASSQQTKKSEKTLQKQDNIDASSSQPIIELKHSPKIKRRPSRKAPAPPLSVPRESAELKDALSSKPNEIETNTEPGPAPAVHNASKNTEKTIPIKSEQGKKSRDSSPQPGKLNIRNLEASMGLSIGKGMQHQMTAKTRPKTKPKPPLLSPKPKLIKPQGEEEATLENSARDGSSDTSGKFSRNPSYSQALVSPTSPKDKLEVVATIKEDADKKFKRTPSYSQALDDLQPDNKRDSVNLAGVTLTSSTDAAVQDSGKEASPKPKKSLIPGMVRVLPPGLDLSKVIVQKQQDSDCTSSQVSGQATAPTGKRNRLRSRTLDDNEIDPEAGLKRSQTVEALLDVEATEDKMDSCRGEKMKKASSAGDILKDKTGSLREGKPIFVPPPPPPYSDLEIAAKAKAMQCPSPKEERSNKRSSKHSVELDDQVFVQDDIKGEDSDSDDDYEPVEYSREFDLGDDDSDDPDHIYEPIPALPPKSKPTGASNNIDIPPIRPPKRPKALRQAPPPPPALSPPTTPMSPQEGMNFSTPPLPPRARRPGVAPGNSPVLSRSPSDMYDTDGYLEPLRKPQTDDVYSYADVPDYPFEKKKTVKEKRPPARKPPTPKDRSPEPMPRAAENKNENRESMASITSVRTSGGSHIYEPIGSALGSLTRENPSAAVPEQRISGRSVFYFGVGDGEGASVIEQDGVNDGILPSSTQNTQTPARDRKASVVEPPQEVLDKEAQEQQDMDTSIPAPQAPPRLKRLQTKADSVDSASPVRRSESETSDSSDDYIYPDNPDMVSPENSMYQKEGEKEEESGKTEEEGVYHEADQQDESIYHEADEPPVGIDEPLYNEADDSAVDCHSGSTSGVASPSSPPPPVPPRDHHKSEPVPQAIRQALHLQRQASALSDTNIILEKKLKLVPKTVSFESQLTDSAFSLSPSSEVTSPTDAPVQRVKQRSLSNPAVSQIVKNDDSFQEDSNSNSSDRPSSWASSGDGYDDPLDPRRSRKKTDDSVSVTSSLHPGSMVFSHGSGSSLNSDPSDLSDNELEEWLKEKADKRKRKIHNIAREIMTSEETFVDILKLLNIDFRLAMAKATEAHEHTVVPPAVMNQILQYLPQVQNFNEELLGDLKERINNWENNPRVGDIFIRKGPFLKMYTFYIREFENSMAALDEARRKYPEFDTAVKAFEASPRCKNLLLKHYMLKPIQRIPQYRLLLQEYQKYLTPENSDYKDTQAALVIVSEVADHANQSMKYGDNFKKLWEIQSSLIGQFEVIKPGREFIKEGMLHKLSRKVMQPRMFFLFSDVLLYTTPVSGGYKLNNHIPLSGVRVSLPTKEDFQNELSILSTQRSFTISASTAQERDEWLATLQAAIKDNAKRRSSFDVRKLHKIPSVLVEVEKDLTLGTRAPVWVPDARVSMCMLCTAEFHVTFRRHHCRACGKVVCGYCSDYRAPLRYLKYKAARVCVECYRKLSKEFDQDGVPDLQAVAEEAEKDSPFSRSSIKARFRGITWGSYRKANKAKRPAVLQEVSANDDLTDMSGYLKVWKARKWKKMWFVLKGKALYTFKASEDAAAIESIVLLGYEVQNFDSWFEGVEPSLVFEIRHTGTAAMVFRTESTASRDKWLNAIREATIP